MRRFIRINVASDKTGATINALLAQYQAVGSARCTPAMEAKIADHIWTVRELLQAAA
jgi:hypothetical protein